MQKDNWLEFKSVLLGLMVKTKGKILDLGVQGLELGFSLQFT